MGCILIKLQKIIISKSHQKISLNYKKKIANIADIFSHHFTLFKHFQGTLKGGISMMEKAIPSNMRLLQFQMAIMAKLTHHGQ
jgi:hypothetical protein